MTERPDDIRELLVPYSIGALDDVTAARVEGALDADPALRAELDEVQRAGAAFLAAGPRHEPPPALKGRVLEAIGAATDADASPRRTDPSPSVTPLRSRRRVRAWPAAAGALAAACVALALVATNLRGELADTRSQLERVESSPADALLRTTGHDVETQDQFAGASGSLVDVGTGYVLVLDDVPDPPAGTSWQVWTADRTGTVRNVGIWRSGTGVLLIPDGDVTQVMVSHESVETPVPAPSGEPIASVQV